MEMLYNKTHREAMYIPSILNPQSSVLLCLNNIQRYRFPTQLNVGH